jgi:mono/diheme cytochrome c family protein
MDPGRRKNIKKKEQVRARRQESDGGTFMQRLRVGKYFSPGVDWSVLVSLLTVMLLIQPVSVTGAAPPTQLAEKGEAIFQQKCAACHTIGKGKLVGPDLQGVGQRVSRDWLERFIAAPSKMFAAKDPMALKLLKEFNIPMPDLGLSNDEVAAVATYLEGPTEAEHHAPASSAAAAAPAASTGNAAVGKELFTGALHLQNGGPACMACHTVAGVGALGGGSVGPDLTHVFQRYGQAGLASALNTLPFPTMQGVFQRKPLAPSEQADLLAFFAQENQKNVPQAASTWSFVWVGLVGVVVLTAASHLVWRRRLKGVRKRLVGGGK